MLTTLKLTLASPVCRLDCYLVRRAPRKAKKVKEAGDQVKAVAGLVGFLFDESPPPGGQQLLWERGLSLDLLHRSVSRSVALSAVTKCIDFPPFVLHGFVHRTEFSYICGGRTFSRHIVY